MCFLNYNFNDACIEKIKCMKISVNCKEFTLPCLSKLAAYLFFCTSKGYFLPTIRKILYKQEEKWQEAKYIQKGLTAARIP